MRLAITSLYLPSGSKIGVGYQVHHFASQMVGRGHEVVVFSQSAASEDATYTVEQIPPRKSLRTFGFAWDLRGVNFSGFDVLHAHGDDWFLWGKRRPRHVHTFHGSCLAECLHAQGWKARLRMGMLAVCETNALGLCDEAVAVSENTRRYIPWVKRVIPNGVDTASFFPGERKSPIPSVLFVGTLHGRKRGRALVEVFQREVRAKVPEAELWMVCEEPVRAPGVRWLGKMATPDLAERYREAWAFCLPSSYEGFGVPYIEAMASGTAVVATPNAGALEVTACGRFGLVSALRELGQALVRVLLDGRLRSALEGHGLERAKDFQWDRICQSYERLYGMEPARAGRVAIQGEGT
ncbi:MAG: hypothetical protein RLZZ142_968 [Verrucomicrobiota bacterium]|jgi:glycosyltransferase involved in cell wall biosynthesis